MAQEKITKQEVEHIAQLSRLGLSDKEISQAAKDLCSILKHFSHIQKIDTSKTPTSDDVTGLVNVTREDAAEDETLCDKNTLLDNAPDTHQGQIKIKAIFE
jgi:aspartyl-tRNA(Asn)/glutamyl-tRNA(Gln) amidotransferase subunit C